MLVMSPSRDIGKGIDSILEARLGDFEVGSLKARN